MEDQRVPTPPILDWMVVSLSDSSEEENDDNFPFETVFSAVEEFQTLVCNEWILQPNAHDNKKKNTSLSSSNINPNEGQYILESLCSEITRNIKEIVRESEDHMDYLEQFNILKAVSRELEKGER